MGSIPEPVCCEKAHAQLPAIKDLHLLAIFNNIKTTTIQQRFPSLFTGLGTLEGEYGIHLKTNYQPCCLGIVIYSTANPRECQRNTSLNGSTGSSFQSSATSTSWCAGMVVVNKKNGGVHVFTDLKPLNRCALWKHRPLPKIDETLAQLSGANTFSKL